MSSNDCASCPTSSLVFTFNSTPTEQGAWKTRIEPASPQQFAQLRYQRWVNDRRAMTVGISADGAELVQRVFPTHADRVSAAFAKLDEDEKRSLASICRKLAA